NALWNLPHVVDTVQDLANAATRRRPIAGGRGGKERAARHERSSDWPRGAQRPRPGDETPSRACPTVRPRPGGAKHKDSSVPRPEGIDTGDPVRHLLTNR